MLPAGGIIVKYDPGLLSYEKFAGGVIQPLKIASNLGRHLNIGGKYIRNQGSLSGTNDRC